MGRSRLDAGDLLAIAIGGVLGATARWAVLSISSPEPSGGWFAYAPNTSVTLGTDIDGFTPVGSAQAIATGSGLPVDTLAVNLAGCLLLGALTLLLTRSTSLRRRLLVAAATGFCGSLTTFSTFAVEVATRLRARPPLSDQTAGLNIQIERDLPGVGLYLALSIAGAAIAFAIGRFLAKRIVDTPEVPTIGAS